jgi:uncharacterized protein YqjF (DUF2071 family)
VQELPSGPMSNLMSPLRAGTTAGRRPVGLQLWRDLLFLHQPVAAELLRALIPGRLTVDTFEGQAWATLIPFAIFGSRPAGTPRALSMNFLEVNLRTYVRGPDGEPGIYFFSLEASSWLAVAGARLAYALPYFPAAMRRHKDAAGTIIRYRSSRHIGQRGAGLEVTWQVGSAVGTAAPHSLDHFLVERYVLFAARGERLLRARVNHDPYPLNRVSVAPLRESLFAAARLPPLSANPPRAHHSPGVDVEIHWRHAI